MAALDRFEPFAPDTLEDPYPFYAALREQAPVHAMPGAGYHAVSRYDLVREVAGSPDVYSSNLLAVVMASAGDSPALLDLGDFEGERPVDVLATADPPQHTRQRKLSGGAFSMRRIGALEESMRALARDLADAFASRGEVEWMSALAVPLPMTVIVDQLGLDRGDLDDLVRWSDAAVGLLSGVSTPDDLAVQSAQILELQRYIIERFELGELAPPDNVLGALIEASRTGDGTEVLTREEAYSLLFQLFVAGNESTASLIGSAVRLLATHPEVQEELRARPERIGAFVEEALRLESPFQGHFRVVRQDTELGGVPLAEGDRIMLLWGAANRDPAVFAEPDRVDLDRPNLRHHMAFGHGIHSCIGAPLARLEARIAIETCLERMGDVRLADPPPRHRPSAFVRRLDHLHLAFDAR